MLTVTEKALDVMAEAIDSGQVQEEQVLRLAKTNEGEFGLVLDEPRDGDQVIHKDDKPILYVDDEVSSTLDGAMLDVAESGGQPRLALKMPEEGAGA